MSYFNLWLMVLFIGVLVASYLYIVKQHPDLVASMSLSELDQEHTIRQLQARCRKLLVVVLLIPDLCSNHVLVRVVARFDGALFAFGDGHLRGMAKAQRRQIRPALSMCDKGYCERLPVKARSLDIGPEGSILIVDIDRILKR